MSNNMEKHTYNPYIHNKKNTINKIQQIKHTNIHVYSLMLEVTQIYKLIIEIKYKAEKMYNVFELYVLFYMIYCTILMQKHKQSMHAHTHLFKKLKITYILHLNP